MYYTSIMEIKRLPLKEFKAIYTKVPRLCVDLVIKKRKGVLLTKRDIPPDKNWWHFPGGTILMHETIKEAAERVAQEELNTKIKIKKLLAVLEYTQGSGLGYPISVMLLVKPLAKKLVGGKQAKTIGYFKTLPEKTLPEVKKFLSETRLIPSVKLTD